PERHGEPAGNRETGRPQASARWPRDQNPGRGECAAARRLREAPHRPEADGGDSSGRGASAFSWRLSPSPSRNTPGMAKSRQPFVVAEVIFHSMKAGDG